MIPPSVEQADLFGLRPESQLPPGFRYERAFVSESEQHSLAQWIQTLPLQPFDFHGFKGNRRVTSFGFRYDYSRQALDATSPIPAELLAVRDRAARWANLFPDAFRQVLVSEYAPGAPIGWHKDKPQFDQVIGISLLSPAIFRLRRRRDAGWDRRKLMLEPGSIYLLSGETRREWEHSIPPVEVLRYSVTFRSLTAEFERMHSSRPSRL